jgi:hypothetical protein
VKWSFPFVLWLPSVHASAIALSNARLHRRFGGLLNLGGAALVTFAVAGTWYVRNFNSVATVLPNYFWQDGVIRGDPPVRSLASAFWYLWNLLNAQLYLIPFLFVLAGIVLLFVKRGLAARNLFPILTVAGTYLAFALMRRKDPTFTLPMLPALAVIATSWLECVAARMRNVLATILVAYGAVAFLVISFGTSLLPKSSVLDLGVSASFVPRMATVFAEAGYLIGPPTREDWHQADPFRTIARVPIDERTFTYEGPGTMWFNANGLDYYTLRYDADPVPASQARFVIDRGLQPDSPSASGVVRLHRWRLPDGGTLALYERE